jgi:hypothetical protein
MSNDLGTGRSTADHSRGGRREEQPQGEEEVMKFFTRDLYRRCRSDDEAVLGAACADWEKANELSEQHVQALEARLPAHLRDFAGLVLHDARVQAVGRQGNRLLLVLHRDIPPRDLVLLDYELESDPVIEPFAVAPGDWSMPTDFQFDELDVEEEGGRPVYRQEIVFGNGWSLRLRFRDVHVTLAQPVVPAADGVTGMPRRMQAS